MLTHFGTLFATWHIYHYLTHLTYDVSRGTHIAYNHTITHCVQSHNRTITQSDNGTTVTD